MTTSTQSQATEVSAKGEVPGPVVVRNAALEDRMGLFKLAAAMHHETDFKSLTFDPHKAIDRIASWIVAEDALMAVAEQGDEIVGMLAATSSCPWFTSDVIASEDLFFVRKDKRGTRTAFRLMQHFIKWAEGKGAAHLRAGIATGEPGANAERLYEHFGFHRVGGSYSLFPSQKEIQQ